MARKIEVVDYCPEWKEKFWQEAAIDSNITEPIIESRIQPTGPPTVTKSDNIPLSTTIDGPIEVTALLLIALFICVFVSPTFSPER